MNRRSRPAPAIRIVHLGLGNFARAHLAWYTQHATDAADWGIAAFTGSSTEVVDALDGQDCTYTLVVRDAAGDRVETIESIVAAHAGGDLAAWLDCFRRPEVAVVTTTVTEAGYRRSRDGGLDLAAVGDDLARVRRGEGPVTSAPGRLVAGLKARHDAGLGGLTLVPCDNLTDNGEVLRRVVLDGAGVVDPELRDWIERECSFASTMVDRITPRPTDADRASLMTRHGIDDAAPVVTEPFTEWVVEGRFVAGRPGWEAAGARFVDDVAPHERRKLTLLNGAHSLLAYAGSLRGHETVAEAMADREVRAWVQQFWADATPHLGLPQDEVDAYCAALVERFANPRIRHLLAQIAADGSQKVPVRIVPTVLAGDAPVGACRAIAAWLLHLRGAGAPVTDPKAEELAAVVAGELDAAAQRLCGWLGIDDPRAVQRVHDLALDLEP